MAVEVVAGSVVMHRGVWLGVPGGNLDIPQVRARIQHGSGSRLVRRALPSSASHDVHVDDMGQRAHAAIVAGDWDALRPLLHPYLHWTDSSGKTFRGRRKVLAMLAQAAQPPADAQSIELRDGQIYRWRA